MILKDLTNNLLLTLLGGIMKSNRLNHFLVSNLLGRKLIMGLFVFSLLLSFTNSIKADIYPFNIRVTQPTNEATFDGSFADGTAAAIRFFTPPSSSHFNAAVKIYNNNTLVKTITANDLSGVDNFVVWDGSLEDGTTAAPTGTYTVEVTTTMVTPVTAYAQAFDFGALSVGLSTRGVTVVTDPTSKNFGYVYAVNGVGTAPWNNAGLTRVSMNGTFAGETEGSQMVTTTGEVIPSTTNRRYSPTAAEDGYIYIVSYNEKKILRVHPDTLNVTFFTTDTIPTNGTVEDVKMVGTGADKKMYVATTTGLFVAAVGNSTGYAGPYTKLLTAPTGFQFWSVQLDEEKGLYLVARTTTSGAADFVYKFNANIGINDTLSWNNPVWTVTLPDGDFVSLDINLKDPSTVADDILYLSIDKAGLGNVLSGIHEITNLNTTPVVNIAFADPDNNTTSTRGECAVDFGGNLIYYENSNEQILIIESPTTNATRTVAGLNGVQITGSGVVLPPVSIAYAKEDADGDFKPDRLGQTFTVIGVVTSINFTKSANAFSYYIQDETAGIDVFKGGVTGGGPVFEVGDRLMVTGTVAQYRGLTELTVADLATDISILDTNNVVTPTVVSVKNFLANPEFYEGKYIQINGVALAPGSNAWPAANTNKSLTIWDGRNKLTLFVDLDTDLDDNLPPVFPINVKGVASQYSSGATVYNDGYQIIPSFYADITQNVSTPPSPYFSLLEPVNNAVIPVTNANDSYTFKWNKAIDFNGDNIIYQFMALPNLVTSSALSDTTYQLTAAKVLQLMGTNPDKTFKWTVRVKGSESTLVSSVDTFTVTFTNNLNAQEDTLELVHNTGDLQVAIFNNGVVGAYNDDAGNSIGTGVVYKGQNGIYSGGVIYGTTAADTVNGNMGSFNVGDLENVTGTFGSGFTTDANFNQITTCKVSDTKSTKPYGYEVIQQTYSAPGTKYVFVRYGFINTTANPVVDLYAGLFADWDIDANTYASNKAGYDEQRNFVYQYDNTKPYYYGLVALNGASGYKAQKGSVANLRHTVFSFLTNKDAVQPTVMGDYRCWIGSKVGNIAVNDTAWVTFAVAVGDNYSDLLAVVGDAFTKAKNLNWTDLVVGVEEENTNVIPEQFFVDQNYPNPFNPTTTIKFGLPQASNVDLRVYNVLGQEVAVLVNGENLSAGSYNFKFDASKLSSGTYIYRLQAGSNVVTKKMMLIK